MTEYEFQLYKAAAVAGSLTVAMTVQMLSPYRKDTSALWRNWRVNFPLAVVNTLAVALLCGGCACLAAQWADDRGMGLANVLALPTAWRIALGIATLDLTAYVWHLANHRIAFLWRFHAVHHSDEFFDTSTAVRFHPMEVLAALPVRLVVVVLVGIPVEGLLAFEMVYGLANFMEHGNTRLSHRAENLLSRLVVTPALHRKHHSQRPTELNSNYGTIFSLWDRLFRTYLPSWSSDTVAVGLPGGSQSHKSIVALLLQPMRPKRLRS